MQYQQKWFNCVLNTQWISLGTNNLIQHQRDSDGIWTLGDITTDDHEISEACRSSDISCTKEFHIIHNSWKIASFKL